MMTTLHISVDEKVADAVRRQAKSEGKTPEVWAAEALAQLSSPAEPRNWVKDFLAATEHPKGDSAGWKWNRAELYDE